MPGKFVAVYMRVSSKPQDTKSQEADLQRWIDANAKGREVKVFKEKHTGTTMARPVWSKLEAAIRNREVSQLVVWRIDRLGRSAGGVTTLFDTLNEFGVNFVSLREGLDLSTPTGKMVAGMLANVAEFETSLRSERTKAGQERARAAGKKIGGGKPGRLCKMTAEQEATIVDQFKAGKSKSAISRATTISRPWVYAVLRRNGLIPQKV